MPLGAAGTALVFGIVFLGTLFQASIGFGLGPIAVPLLVLILPGFIPGPLLLSALILTLLMARRDHRHIDLRGVKIAVPGRLCGTLLGILLLTQVPEKNLAHLFGGMVLFAAFLSIIRIHPSTKAVNIFTAGVFSGLMGTTSAIGGAPMALVYQGKKGPEIRGTLSSIFVFGTMISLLALGIAGRFGMVEMRLSLILIPGILAGFWVSRFTSRILDGGLIRPAILILSAAAGLIVILTS